MVSKLNIVIFGPPGAGKGTQAQYLATKLKYYQISTGDLLRNESKNFTDLGKKISKIIDKGEFVSDDIVNDLLYREITKPEKRNKIIFDGYPRNILQAKNLDKLLKNDNQKIGSIIYLNVTKEVIKNRIIGRVVCQKCNIIFNEFENPKALKNHQCKKKFLKRRSDDDVKVVIKRYDTYIKQTKPILDYYSNRTIFKEVDGSKKIEEITSKIDQIITV